MSRFEFMRGREIIEREYPVGRAPRSVRVNGRVFRRIPSIPALAAMADDVNGRECNFLDVSIPQEHFKYHRGRFGKNQYGETRPIFSSKQDRDSFQRAAGKDGHAYEYGTRRG